MIRLEPLQPALAFGAPQSCLRLGGEPHQVIQQSPPHLVLAARLAQTLQRELANDLEIPMPRAPGHLSIPHHQRLGAQGRQYVEQLQLVPARNRGGGLERPTRREHREPHEQLSLIVVQEAMTPLERRGEQPLSRRQPILPRRAQSQDLPEPGADLLDIQHLQAAGDQLERERDTVGVAADGCDGRCVVGGQAERGIRLDGTVHEELDCLVSHQLVA